MTNTLTEEKVKQLEVQWLAKGELKALLDSHRVLQAENNALKTQVSNLTGARDTLKRAFDASQKGLK